MIEGASAIGEEALLSQLSSKQEEIINLKITPASAQEGENWYYKKFSEVRHENRNLLDRNPGFEEEVVRLQAVEYVLKMSNLNLEHENQQLQVLNEELRREKKAKRESGPEEH